MLASSHTADVRTGNIAQAGAIAASLPPRRGTHRRSNSTPLESTSSQLLAAAGSSRCDESFCKRTSHNRSQSSCVTVRVPSASKSTCCLSMSGCLHGRVQEQLYTASVEVKPEFGAEHLHESTANKTKAGKLQRAAQFACHNMYFCKKVSRHITQLCCHGLLERSSAAICAYAASVRTLLCARRDVNVHSWKQPKFLTICFDAACCSLFCMCCT